MAVDATSPVTSVNSANPWANAGASTSDANKASVNYDSFLKLLIAQMKNQDPTNPMDASQQISQLASFSQVEQSIQTNNHLKSMLQAEALTRAGDMIGKYIMSADDSVTGKITKAEVYSDGLLAVTDTGKKVMVQAGVVLSDSPIATNSSTSTKDGETGTTN